MLLGLFHLIALKTIFYWRRTVLFHQLLVLFVRRLSTSSINSIVNYFFTFLFFWRLCLNLFWDLLWRLWWNFALRLCFFFGFYLVTLVRILWLNIFCCIGILYTLFLFLLILLFCIEILYALFWFFFILFLRIEVFHALFRLLLSIFFCINIFYTLFRFRLRILHAVTFWIFYIYFTLCFYFLRRRLFWHFCYFLVLLFYASLRLKLNIFLLWFLWTLLTLLRWNPFWFFDVLLYFLKEWKRSFIRELLFDLFYEFANLRFILLKIRFGFLNLFFKVWVFGKLVPPDIFEKLIVFCNLWYSFGFRVEL